MTYQTYNQDCRQGLKNIPTASVDLIFTDPPYGIDGAELDRHYNRDESKVVVGYIDIDRDLYGDFCREWITECSRILKPTGSMYIVSGYSNLHHILNALHSTDMREINHIIAEYSFGVYTKNKWVSSHYHVLYWGKSKKTYFNGQARTSDTRQSYNDRLSVQKLTREYQPNTVKNKNQLPVSFIEKFIEYSSKPGDTVLDPFAGSFSTGAAANKLQRNFIGFEQNVHAYNTFGQELAQCP
jgi:site-specific DNA-methyltransferase (adenine-specific)